jgi:hypothetical protein
MTLPPSPGSAWPGYDGSGLKHGMLPSLWHLYSATKTIQGNNENILVVSGLLEISSSLALRKCSANDVKKPAQKS